MKTSRDKPQKRKYRKPAVKRVVLMPEEAVLGACKNPGIGGCDPPGHHGGRLPGS